MKAVIFDMDGVLVLTEKMHYSLYKDVLKKHGFSLTPAEYATYFAGKRTKEAFESYLHKHSYLESSDSLVKKFRSLKRDILFNALKEYVELRKDTASLLIDLKKKYALAIATSTIKEFTNIIVTSFNINQYFTVIVYAEDVAHGKPDPEVYLTAAKRLGISPSDCIVIEDAQNGVDAAKNAGMKCVSIGPSSLQHADYHVTNFKELQKLLHSI
jgi:beta-phosphoglucomutase family hydrolase